jgi:hypothetical protein
MTDDDKLRDAAEALAAIDHQRAKTLLEAERDFQAAKDRRAVERAKSALIAATQNGPRYHPYLVPTPLTDEMIDDAFDDLLRPNARKARMIEEVEAKHQAKLSINSAAYAKHGHPGLRKRLIFSSVSVLLMTNAILIHWRIGVIAALMLLASACFRTTSWSE